MLGAKGRAHLDDGEVALVVGGVPGDREQGIQGRPPWHLLGSWAAASVGSGVDIPLQVLWLCGSLSYGGRWPVHALRQGMERVGW